MLVSKNCQRNQTIFGERSLQLPLAVTADFTNNSLGNKLLIWLGSSSTRAKAWFLKPGPILSPFKAAFSQVQIFIRCTSSPVNMKLVVMSTHTKTFILYIKFENLRSFFWQHSESFEVISRYTLNTSQHVSYFNWQIDFCKLSPSVALDGFATPPLHV